MNFSSIRDTALVIDDDPNCREMIQAIGQIWGVTVLEAGDCRRGLEILEQEKERIKVILLDYFMPGMDPAKCVASIVAKAGKNIDVVLLTAAPDPATRAAELKMRLWLSKPFDIAALRILLTGCAT